MKSLMQPCVDVSRTAYSRLSSRYLPAFSAASSYAADYLPAADVQMMMHGTAARLFKWPAE